MFVLRAAIATFSVFVISYTALSVLLLVAWRQAAKRIERGTSSFQADALYLLRVSPALGAASAALLYELPSFLRFEPRATSEALTPVPLILVTVAIVAGVFFASQMVVACRRTADLCRRWVKERTSTERDGFSIHESESFAPPIAVAGVFTQRLLLSPKVSAVLEREELSRALAHEAAHIRRRDNLRKLMLIACRFPGLGTLEHAWAEAAEFAADQRAVSNKIEALALASAIVKVAALRLPSQDPRALVTNFVGSASSTVLRVQKLAHWQDENSVPVVSRSRSVAAVILAVAVLAISYSPAISFLHSFTEILFR